MSPPGAATVWMLCLGNSDRDQQAEQPKVGVQEMDAERLWAVAGLLRRTPQLGRLARRTETAEAGPITAHERLQPAICQPTRVEASVSAATARCSPSSMPPR